MGEATSIAIDQASKQDLQWFIACARAVNGTVSIYKCLQPRIHLYVDASLYGLAGVFGVSVYTHTFSPRTGWSIGHWEAINVFVALQVFSHLVQGQLVTIWCDSRVVVSVLQASRGQDPILHAVARNIWLFLSAIDCDVEFRHVPGSLNRVADLLSLWSSTRRPLATLFFLLNQVPLWCQVPSAVLDLDYNI
jgi:hypothetical protein